MVTLITHDFTNGVTLSLSLSLSLRFNGQYFFPGERLAGFIGAKDAEVVVTTGAIRRAKLQSNRHTNKPTPNFLQAVVI